MKRQLATLILVLSLILPVSAQAALTLDGTPLDVGETSVYDNTTFVSLRSFFQELFPTCSVQWSEDHAIVQTSTMTLIVHPGESTLSHNGTTVELSQPVRLEEGRTLVPIRTLASLVGLDVFWDSSTGDVSLSTSTQTDDSLYWLSRIISAESQGESYTGKIAVGNVVLNRVADLDFPNTIYGVIFDDRWGGQFEPVRNGTIYQLPTLESIQAALACLDGENAAGSSLYFLAPDLTTNHWIMENRSYVTTIGVHWFYQ